MTYLLISIVFGIFLGIGGLQIYIACLERNRLLARRVWEGGVLVPKHPFVVRMWIFFKFQALRVVEMIGSTDESVRRRLELAGRRMTISAFRLQQFVCATAAFIIGTLSSVGFTHMGESASVIIVTAMIVSTISGSALCDRYLSWSAHSRQRRIDSQVPDASELFSLSVGAGESIPAAIERVAGVSQSELAQEFSYTSSQIRLGCPTTKALADLSKRNDAGNLIRLCQTLITAIERGAPLTQALQDQVSDIHESTHQHLLEEGGKREISMLVPVVFLILPITVLFALYPGLVALNIGP